ncbi:serine carboxypeptidase-like 17 [Fagus crenata]
MQCIKDLFRNDILEPKCAFATPKLNTELDRRSLEENPTDFILSPPRIPEYWCRNFNYALSYVWSNDDTVQDALHVRKGFVLDWKRCNKSLSYTKDILSVVDVHRYLTKLYSTLDLEPHLLPPLRPPLPPHKEHLQALIAAVQEDKKPSRPYKPEAAFLRPHKPPLFSCINYVIFIVAIN